MNHQTSFSPWSPTHLHPIRKATTWRGSQRGQKQILILPKYSGGFRLEREGSWDLDADPKSPEIQTTPHTPTIWATWSWHGCDIYRRKGTDKKDTQKKVARPEKCGQSSPSLQSILGKPFLPTRDPPQSSKLTPTSSQQRPSASDSQFLPCILANHTPSFYKHLITVSE